jgi:PAS domain S-box-containing protein
MNPNADQMERTLRHLREDTSSRRWKTDPVIVSSLRRFSMACGFITIVLASIVLLGWVLDIDRLRGPVPDLVSMKANTAVALLLSGVALSLFVDLGKSNARLYIFTICYTLVVIIGLLTLTEFVVGWDLGIDQLLFREPPGAAGTVIPGRMAVNSAIVFLGLGVALGLLRSRSRAGIIMSQLLAIATALIALTGVLSYAFAIADFYGFLGFTKMAIHTAMGLFLFSIGVLCAKPDGGLFAIISAANIGGTLARRMLPLVLILPVVVGLLRLAGERAGLFRGDVGVMIVAIIYVIMLSIIVLFVARSLNQVDEERKRTTEALETERTLLRTLVDNLPDRVYSKDTQGRFLLNNVAHIHALNASPSVEIVGKTDFDFRPAEIAQRSHDDEQNILSSGEPLIQQEERTVLPNGELGWLLTSKIPVRNLDGDIVGIVGIGRDITSRKRTEEALRQERILLRTVLDNLPDAVYAKDIQGRKTLANPADVRCIGATTEAEVLGKDDFELFPMDLAEKYFVDDQTVIRLGMPVINREEHRIGTDGQPGWLLTSKVPLRDGDGNIIGLVGIGHDITARKRTEMVIKESEEKFRSLTESATDAIICIDAERRVLVWNRAAESIFGFTASEMLGQVVDGVMPERLLQRHLEGIDRMLNTDHSTQLGRVVESVGKRKDGSEFPIELSLALWDGSDGRRFTASIRDITERKRVEEANHKSLQEKEILLKEIHHRVKNNLAVVSGLLRLQERQVENEEAQNALREAQDRIRSMALIHEKLYQSQTLARIDFGNYLQHLVASLSRTQKTPGLDITMNVRAENIHFGIETAIPCGLLVNELVSNAFKHAFRGRERGSLSVLMTRKGGQFVLNISDDGIGLPPDLEMRKNDSLGLQLVYSLANQLDGTIEMHSNGRTEFCITFADPDGELTR